MPHFRYSELPPGNDRTRLLRLLPNEDNTAPIKCQLLNYSLQKNRNGAHLYDALSYVWGTSAKSQVIYIEDGEFKVNQNLHSALRRLRDPTFERILWVDAICINQGDDKEKERQIQAMGKIYAGANQVVVWLGNEADESNEAMKSIRAKAAGSYGVSEDGNININDAALSKLCERSWFRRIWVVQEVGLARNIRVLCGSAEVAGHAFGLALRADRNPTVRAMGRNMGEAIFRPQCGIYPLAQLSLVELIDIYHTHEASLRHDKIYALLGMSSDGSSAKDLLPNYNLPWEELFTRLIKYALGETVSVRIGEDKDTAMIQAKGWVLGRVHEVQRSSHNRQILSIYFTGECFWTTKRQHDIRVTVWTVRDSARDIRKGDLVCQVQGAPEPTIIRHCDYHFDIILLKTTCIGSKSFPPEYKLPMQARPARNLYLVWSWKQSSTNTDSFASTTSGTFPAIDQMLWDTNLILHDAADNAKSAKQAYFHVAEMLLVFEQKLKYHHPKTQLAVYGLAMLNAACPGVSPRLYVSQILNDMFPNRELRDKLGYYYNRWRYWDDKRFVTGNLGSPYFSKDKFEQLIAKIEDGKKHDWHPFTTFH
ncbi:hypothetical protein ABOM_003328 [Aspergillus bombycis]|uniref:Heterokaryon incompatibility domain-containing protein n=1 Tax=Aspergillus bombycis TaxID=109264 RepID=A0A1F8A7X4_9EURO|nr:hypothetical protein ABOM_003328 [Aspergillus bombycis]OGM47791.1 hypothetical protein ABOM_003328 [Aspergillus bombycis]